MVLPLEDYRQRGETFFSNLSDPCVWFKFRSTGNGFTMRSLLLINIAM
jgi:hypothetical protein